MACWAASKLISSIVIRCQFAEFVSGSGRYGVDGSHHRSADVATVTHQKLKTAVSAKAATDCTADLSGVFQKFLTLPCRDPEF